jgi:branched-subunit amino acid aminotransferase/4-amino-4-deoxychorismate lyase
VETKQQAFFEGRFVPLEDAKISIMTTGFLYGTAIFEGLRAYWNERQQEIYIFRLREHFDAINRMVIHTSDPPHIKPLAVLVQTSRTAQQTFAFSP